MTLFSSWGAFLILLGSIANIHHVYCGCGKKFKGLHGLKTHQRTCRFVMGLNEELIQPEQDNELETNDIEDLISTSSNPDSKPGGKIPSDRARMGVYRGFSSITSKYSGNTK